MENASASTSAKKTWTKRLWTTFSFLSLLAVGGLIGYFFSYVFKTEGTPVNAPNYYKFLIIPLLLGIIFLVLAIHELGHTFAGMWVGFEFRMITVGPFMLRKEMEKIRFRWNTRLNAAGGLALCLPKTNDRLRSKFMKFVAGGPLASLLFAALSFLIYYLFFPSTKGSLMGSFWKFSALMSALIFIVTILPMHSGGFFSDGARLLNLIKGGQQTEIDLAILTTTTASSSGIRPRDLNIAPIQKILEAGYEHPFIPYLHLYMHAHLSDQGKIEEAHQFLLRAFEQIHHIPAGYQAILWLDLAFHQAYYQQNVAEAKASFQKAKISAVIPKHSVFKSEAAIAWGQQKYTLALQKAQVALEVLPQAMDAGGAIAEKEWLESFIEEVTHQQTIAQSK